MKRILWIFLVLIFTVPCSGQDIAVDMTDQQDDTDIVFFVDSCECGLVDDQSIRDQINLYTWEIALLTQLYVSDARVFGPAQEREIYWRNQVSLAQTAEERSEASAAYTSAFNLRLFIAARMSRTLNRISILFQAIQQLERQLNQ